MADSVAVAAVTFDRPDDVRTLLKALAAQTVPLSTVALVDSGTRDVADIAAESEAKVSYVRSHTNLGGAGGFSLAILTALASGYFYSASVTDQTVLGRSLWARMEEDTLTGLFLRNMRQRLDGAAEADKPTLERAIRFGLAALEGREEPK